MSFLLKAIKEEFSLMKRLSILYLFFTSLMNCTIFFSASIDSFKIDGYENNLFNGPHPAGNVGVQIHHIDPVNKGDVVWSTTPFGLIQIGKLFLNGIYDASKTICLVGSEAVSYTHLTLPTICSV